MSSFSGSFCSCFENALLRDTLYLDKASPLPVIPPGAMRTVLFSRAPLPANGAVARHGTASTSRARGGWTVVPNAGGDDATSAEIYIGKARGVYTGKGRFIKDDPRRYAGRDDWFTGGWPGGEVGLKQGLNVENSVASPGSGMVPVGNVRGGGRTTREIPRVSAMTDAFGEGPTSDSSSETEQGASGGNAQNSTTPSSKVASLKFQILKTLATLDRGVAADDGDREAVREIVKQLESVASSDAKTFAPTDDILERALDGEWRLAYSSTFAGEQVGSQGFTGAPGGGTTSLGSVYQNLSRETKTCDNAVSLAGKAGPFPGVFRGVASLGHTYKVTGRTMRITFTGVTVESETFGLGKIKLPSPLDALPDEARALLTGAGAQSGAFDTTFVDTDLRISRGDRGETRVFVR
jgi:hypothetical protein